MANTTRILPPEGAPATVEASAGLPANWWFPVLGVALLVVAIVVAVRAGLRASSSDRPKRALSSLGASLTYIGLPYLALASWVYRPELNAAIGKVWFFLQVLGFWFADMTPAQRVGYGLLLLVFLWEMKLYVKFARLVWRGINPDLLRRATPSGTPTMIGRLYGQEKLPDRKRAATADELARGEVTWEGANAYVREPGGYRLYFVPHDGGMFDFIWRQCTLDVPREPDVLSRREVVIDGLGIEKDPSAPLTYRVRHELQAPFPFGGESAESLMVASLEDNKLVSQNGIDGNPHVLARRAARHQGTYVPVRSRRAAAPAGPSTPVTVKSAASRPEKGGGKDAP